MSDNITDTWGAAGDVLVIPPANRTSVTLRYMDPESLCPDLLGLDYIGEADHLRGRVVRAFFWLMRAWPKPRSR